VFAESTMEKATYPKIRPPAVIQTELPACTMLAPFALGANVNG